MKHILMSTMALAFMTGSAAYAQDLVYEPVNPSFGGNPFNSAHLLALANAQNDYDPPEQETSSQDDLDRFVRSLQSRLLSSLSTQVANAIFGEDAQDEGTIIFGDQTISFVRTLDGIVLTITEADGSQTVITIPVLQTGDDADEGDTKQVETSGKTSLLVSNTRDSLESSLESNSLGKTQGSLTQLPALMAPIETPIQ